MWYLYFTVHAKSYTDHGSKTFVTEEQAEAYITEAEQRLSAIGRSFVVTNFYYSR